jgi:methanogenic corrinoid protein MtbC1
MGVLRMDVIDELAISITDLKGSEELKKCISKALSSDIAVEDIVENGIRKGLYEVGKRYEENTYFLAELLYAASLVNEAFTLLRPRLTQREGIGKIILGTVRGDIHDIGKNIFKMLAEATGFEGYDLGVDIDSAEFIQQVKEIEAPILGLSALLTTILSEMQNIIIKLESAGIRKEVKVLLGGNAVTKEFAREIGADYASLDAVEGVEICKQWVEER